MVLRSTGRLHFHVLAAKGKLRHRHLGGQRIWFARLDREEERRARDRAVARLAIVLAEAHMEDVFASCSHREGDLVLLLELLMALAALDAAICKTDVLRIHAEILKMKRRKLDKRSRSQR